MTSGYVRPRASVLAERPVRSEGAYVLYWMVGARRTRWNPALEHAVALCAEHRRPLLVLEALRAAYPWASPRLHAFVMDGMADDGAAFARAGVTAIRYVEPRHGDGAGLLEALATRAVTVVTDRSVTSFLPRMQDAVARRLDVRVEAVDGVGILPLAATGRAWPTASGFRRHLQKALPDVLQRWPAPDPLASYRGGRAAVPEGIAARWPSAERLQDVALAHDTPVVARRGGSREAERALQAFLDGPIDRYHTDARHPDLHGASGLSPYLHFGHLSAAEVVHAVLERAGWTPDRLGPANGSRGGWGLPEGPEAFLDELVTWRELGQAWAWHAPDAYTTYGSVPAWARASLAEHAGDRREVLTMEQLGAGESGDPVWDAAQRQLLRDGTIHTYLRMLWGKNVLAWSRSPEEAFERLFILNDRYALDGRDPNSASGIAWIFGRHDRAWGPERAIYGKVRYMTSESTVRKLRMSAWLERYASA